MPAALRLRSDRWAWAGLAVAAGCFALPWTPWGAARAVIALGVFLLVPGFLWRRRQGWTSDEWIDRAARLVLDGALHDLAVLALVAMLGVSLRAGLALWVISLLLPMRAGEPAPGPRGRSGREGWLLAAGMALLAVWMAATPLALGLQRDSAAHVAGVRDAMQADTWLPPDRSYDVEEERPDPRFGVGHGLYAALAEVADLEPESIFAYGPVVMAPLWLLAHTALFLRFGLSPLAALAASFLFTVGGAGGRGFGLWFSVYPGNVALLVGALAFADWVGGHSARRSLGLRPTRLRGPLVLALSALLHPFAWVGFTTAAAHAVVLAMASRRWRPRWRSLALETGLAVAAGAILLAPRLVERGTTQGAHYQITDALFLGRSLFVVDPLVLEQWSGRNVWWTLPVLALLIAGLRRWPRFVFAFACVLPMWTISLDPLAQPLAWKTISYLSVRFGRLAFTPALWMLVIASAAWGLRRRGNLASRVLLVGAALSATLLIARETSDAWRTWSWRSPRSDAPAWHRVDAIVDALETLPAGRVLADPRLSYGLRARTGGAIVLYPVAHASPRDATLTTRLAWYRDVLDPQAPWPLVVQRLRALQARYLVVHPGVEEFYVRMEFGFVPHRDVQETLAARARALGVEPVASGEAWSVFDVEDLQEVDETSAPIVPVPEPPARRLEPVVTASRFEIVAVEPLATRVAAGDSLAVRVWYQTRDGSPVTVNPDWEQVFLRFEGPMPEVPGWARPFGKLYRKWFIERSGRSEARFGARWVPLDGSPPPSRWLQGQAAENRFVQVPPRIVPGVYTVQPTVQEITWRPNREWRDYLRDRDRYTGPVAATLEIIAPGG